MKNLKKVLALVLVVATLMTMTTIASAKFTDDGSIEYNEAVEVMSMINVINGYTDGSFRPTANVTRAQMAKMVAYIVAGGEDVGNLYAGANSFSDCTTHWAKGYIAYANKTGIVAGVGNGKFNPEGSVTGTQAAKMMLCALGYDAKAEGYTGTNWAVNTLADAKAAGLLEGLSGVDMSKAMTREQAAQLMFNALKATMVYYENGNITIDSGDTNITIGGSAAKEVEVKGETASTNFDHTANAATIGTKQLCEEYFSGLTLSTAGTDAFARTGNVWTYKNDGKTTDSAVYASAADYSIVVSESGKSVAQWAEKAYSKLNTSNATVYVNGVKTTTPGALLVGDQVEFFVDDNDANKVNEVVVIRYTADVITDVDTDVKDADAKDGVSAYVTFKNAGTFDDTDLTGYDVNTYKKDAVVALVEGSGSYAGKIVASYAPEAVEGAITAYTSTTYTIDGTKYTMVGGIGNNDEINNSVDFTNGSYKLYLDVNGYVLKTEVVKGTASINDVFYLSDISNNNVYWTDTVSEKGQTTTNYYVQAVYMDGTVKEIEVASVKNSDNTNKNSDNTKKTAIEGYLNGLNAGFFTDEDKTVTYDTNKTYDVSLTVWSNSDYSTTGDLATGSGMKINSDTKRVGNYYLSNNTQYVVIEKYTDSDTKVTVKTGSISYEEAANDIVMVIGSKSGGSTVADYVVIVSDTFTAAETGDYIYVDDNAATNVSGGKQYTVYTKDGEKTTIVVDKDSTKTTLSKNTFYKYAIMANGNYDIKDTMTANLDDGVTYTGSYNDLLTVSGNAKDIVTSDAAIVDVHDTDDYSKSVTTLAAMQTAKDANYTVTLQVVYTDSNKDEAEMIVVKSVVGTSSSVLDDIANGTAGVNGTMIATPSVDGNDVTMSAQGTYITDKNGDVMQISADLARFLGGLHNAGVKEIKYAGVTYKWNTEGTLVSSNWTKDGANDGNTLVKAITDNWKGTDGNWGTSDDAAYTATLSIDGVNMTYTVSIAK